MNIQKIQSNTSFTAWRRVVYNTTPENITPKVHHKNNTWFFRCWLDWKTLPKFLDNEFQDVKKVNSYFYGCSDGTDAYSYMMTMFTQLKEKANKFLPVKGFDYDDVAIKRAESGCLNISHDDKLWIQYYTDKRMDDFWENIEGDLYKPKSILSNKITFELGDITKDYKKIEPENTLLAARNFWPYLEPNDRYNLAKNLYKHMKKNSLLFIGEYDIYGCSDLKSMLCKIGWTPTSFPYIYKKNHTKSHFTR